MSCVLGFDFSKLNGIVSFYLVEFLTFNTCAREFFRGGITPFESTYSNIWTLVRFESIT